MFQPDQETAYQPRNRRASTCPPNVRHPDPAAARQVVDQHVTLTDLGPVRYRLLGASSNPPLVVLGGISADRRVDHWWSDITGDEGALSTRRFRLVSMDWPEWPDGARPQTIDEHADALARMLDALGIGRISGFVGASFGAMVGLSFAARHPGRLNRLVAISGAHHSTPAATAARIIQRELVETLAGIGQPARGVALARKLALTGYRPAELFGQRFFDADPDRVIDRITGYLEHNGARFAAGFEPGRYLALSTALDRHRVDPAAIRCPTELIGAPSDALVPVSQLRELAGAIGMHARLHLIDSPYGHDAFLKSAELLNPLLERVLDDAGGDETDRGDTRRGVAHG